MNFSEFDHACMQQALQLARQAHSEGEVPIGAALVFHHDVSQIMTGYNQSIQLHDPTAHAEIQVLRKAGQMQNNYRLIHSTLYVTLEPCLMCLGAMLHARISRLVFAAHDAKVGACQHLASFSAQLNHRFEIQSGLCLEESATLLKDFFKARR